MRIEKHLLLGAFYSLHCNEIVIASEAKQSPKDCHVATLLAMTTWFFQSKLFYALGNN